MVLGSFVIIISGFRGFQIVSGGFRWFQVFPLSIKNLKYEYFENIFRLKSKKIILLRFGNLQVFL